MLFEVLFIRSDGDGHQAETEKTATHEKTHADHSIMDIMIF